jgi:hypothetical protein
MLSATGIAPGSVVIVRDEEWLVTKMETSDGVTLLSVQGLSELVRGTRATFLDSLNKIEVSIRPPLHWSPTTHRPTGAHDSGRRRPPARLRFPLPTGN